MTVSWDLIRSFDAVAKSGSLLAAAQALGLSQPTLGRHIDALEAALAVTLFDRSREGMTLTAAGANLVDVSADMAQAADGVLRVASGLDQGVAGVVRLSVNDVLGVHVMPEILRDFIEMHVGIQVELDITNAAANLLRRDADVAVRMFRPTQNDLVARKLGEIPLGFYAHARYVARHGAPETLAALTDHRVIGFDREPWLIDAARALGVRLSPSDFALRCDSIPAQVAAVRAGLGIGILHQGLAARHADLRRLLPQVDVPAIPLWVACHREVRHNKRVRLLVDFLGERLRDPYGPQPPPLP